MNNSKKMIKLDWTIAIIIAALNFIMYFKINTVYNDNIILTISLGFFDLIAILTYNIFKKKNPSNLFLGTLILIIYYSVEYFSVIFSQKYVQAFLNSNISQKVIINDYFSISMLITSILSICVVLIFIAFNIKKVLSDIKSIIFNPISSFFKIVFYIIIMLLLISFFGYISNLLFPKLAQNNVESLNQNLIVYMIEHLNVALMFVSIVLSGPLFEELIFRHGLVKRLLSIFNKYVAAFLGTLFFVLLHLIGQNFTSISEDIYLSLGYLPVSLVINFVYVKEENILYSLTLHMTNNLIAFLSIYNIL